MHGNKVIFGWGLGLSGVFGWEVSFGSVFGTWDVLFFPDSRFQASAQVNQLKGGP